MGPDLIEVRRLHDHARHPRGLAHAIALLREFAKCVAIPLCDPSCQRQALLHFRIIRREQDAALRLDRQHGIADGEMQPFRHIFWQRRADRATNLAQLDFPNHEPNVAHMCYCASGSVAHAAVYSSILHR